ncbi:MAG: hypothetical protein JWR01_724 [Subtercola sp.]|nr:hypothetical protein [Subtercola sp.]
MKIDWLAFIEVVVVALVSACFIVTTFALALRLGDGTARWRRPVSVTLFVVCGLAALFGVYLIIPALHGG